MYDTEDGTDQPDEVYEGWDWHASGCMRAGIACVMNCFCFGSSERLAVEARQLEGEVMSTEQGA